MRRRTEEDNDVERQLRYEVEGDLETQMARAAESESRAEILTFRNDSMTSGWEAMQRSERNAIYEKLEWINLVRILTNGSEAEAWELSSSRELLRRIPDTRRGRIRRWIREAHREMMLDRQRSREGTPPR